MLTYTTHVTINSWLVSIFELNSYVIYVNVSGYIANSSITLCCWSSAQLFYSDFDLCRPNVQIDTRGRQSFKFHQSIGHLSIATSTVVNDWKRGEHQFRQVRTMPPLAVKLPLRWITYCSTCLLSTCLSSINTITWSSKWIHDSVSVVVSLSQWALPKTMLIVPNRQHML